MASKVFISWSGELSKELAEAINDWLHEVIQTIDTYFSPIDIEKGSKWDAEISKSLEASSVGLICLTPDNLNSRWILFEAGALSKTVDKSRVCTILFNITPTDVEQPLAGFQATPFSKTEFEKLIKTIFDNCETGISEFSVVKKSFDRCWNDFDAKINAILAKPNKKTEPRREQRDILEEILSLTRSLSMERERMPIRMQANENLERTIMGLERHSKSLIRLIDLFNNSDENLHFIEMERLIESFERLCIDLNCPPEYMHPIISRFGDKSQLMRSIRNNTAHNLIRKNNYVV